MRRIVNFARRWLFGRRGPRADGYLSYRVGDRTYFGRVVNVSGFHMVVSTIVGGATDARVIGPADAADVDEYWVEWRAAGGPELYDADGRPVDPADYA